MGWKGEKKQKQKLNSFAYKVDKVEREESKEKRRDGCRTRKKIRQLGRKLIS